MIDLRSDTVTRPTPAMRAAMASAEVGDDVYGEDPTVSRLEERTAALLGKEAAVFMPSGTMSNQIAIRLHCLPGDELIADAQCHILRYEQGAYAQFSGVAAHAVACDGCVMTRAQLEEALRPDNVHHPRTRLLCLENTHNRGGGAVLDWNAVVAACDWAAAEGVARHLDGARLFNAAVASGIAPATWAARFDTVSVCFSKGLGAPVGSALAGSADAMAAARRHRKAFGGGLRQAGVLAAAALHALDCHVERLAEDHRRAQRLAAGIADIEGLSLANPRVATNLVVFRVDPARGTAADFCAALRCQGVALLPISRERVRAATHLDIDDAAVAAALHAMQQLPASLAAFA
jgi:threonine aldolase